MAGVVGQDDDIISSLVKANANQKGGAVASTGQDSDILQSLHENPTKISPSGQSEEPMSGWGDGAKGLMNNLEVGYGQFHQAGAGWRLIGDSNLKVDDVRGDVETDAMAQAQMETPDWTNTRMHWKLFNMRDLPWGEHEDKSYASAADIPGWLVRQVPMLGAAAGSALIGAGAGTMILGPAGTIPGALLGAAGVTGMVMAGSHTYEQMNLGVNRDHAVAGGLAVGAIGGMATALGMGKLGAMAPEVAASIFASQGFKSATGQVLTTMGLATGVDMAAAGMQSTVDSIAKYLETRASGNAPGTKPFTLKEAIGNLVTAEVQQIGLSGAMGAVGIHAGMRSVKLHAERLTAEALHEQTMLHAKVAEAKALEETKKIQEADTASKTVESQARARKSLKGFLQVDQPVDTATALTNLNNAIQAHNAAPAEMKAQQKLIVKQAEAELQQAKYTARVRALEEALTEPDLVARSAEHIADLERRLKGLKRSITDLLDYGASATSPAIQELQGAIKIASAELSEVKEIAKLGTHEKIKAHLEALKAQIDEHANESQLKVAAAALKRRMAEREKVIDTLRGEIREEKKAAKDNGGEAQTAERRERLETLREQQAIDELFKELIEQKLVTPEDIADLSPKVPTKRLMGLVKLAKKNIDRAGASSAAGQKKIMVASKKLLDSVIDLSRIPAADKNKLKALYAHADYEKLQAVLPEIQDKIKALFDKRQLEAANKDLKAQLETIGDKSGKATRFPGTTELLQTIKDFAEDPSAVDRLEINLSMKNKLTPIEEMQLDLAAMFDKPVKEMTVPEIENILDTVVSLKETGKAKALERVQEKVARQEKLVNEVIAHMEPDARGNKFLTSDEHHIRLLRALHKLWNDNPIAELTPWRSLMTVITQFGKISDLTHLFNVKSLMSQMHLDRIKWENRWKELVTAQGISEKEYQKFLVKSHKLGEKLEYQKFNGTAFEWRKLTAETPPEGSKLLQGESKAMSIGQMIQTVLHLEDMDPDAISRLSQGNRYSYPGEVPRGASTGEVIRAYLNEHVPGWRKYANATQQLYNEFHAVVDGNAFERFGRHIDKNETYGGELLSSAEPGTRFNESFRRFSTKARSTMERTGGKKEVRVAHFIDTMKNHIMTNTREANLGRFEQDAQAIFMHNKEIQGFIKRNIGDNTLKVIHTFIQDMLLGYNKSYSKMDKFFTMIRENTYTRFLGANPAQFAKQITGVVRALQLIGPDELIAGLEYKYANPKEAHDLMMQSGIYQARTELRDRDARPAAPSQLKRFNAMFMKSVEVGDHWSVELGGFPVLFDVLKKTGDMKKAIAAFEYYIDATQSTGSLDELPNMFRGNAAQRMMTIMAGEPVLAIDAINVEARKYFNNPTKAGAAKFVRTTSVVYAGAYLYNLVGYMVAYPFMSDDEREQKWDFMNAIAPLGPFSGIPMLGGLAAEQMVHLNNLVFNKETKAYEPHMLGADPFTDISKMLGEFGKVAQDGGGDAATNWKAIMYAGNVVGDFTGIPVTNIIKPAKPKE